MVGNSLFWYVVFAGSGGVLVFVGLLAEQLAEKKWFKNIKSFRRWKYVKAFGEWLVIGGVFIEIAVAGVSAVNEFEDDPRNQTISSASAFVDLIITENPRGRFPQPSSDSAESGWWAVLYFWTGTNSSNSILALKTSGQEISWWNMGSESNREWRLLLHEDPLNFLTSESDRNKTLVKQFDDVKALTLSMPFATNMVVQTGSVVLTVNDLKWSFEIPKQKPKWNIITMYEVKDKNGLISSQIMPVKMVDWVSPPRFTNLVYTGQ
ncbi:MAG TPA: hypothetical protein VK811_07045 [Candidatus Acidoferrum sp.]|jgi:hypothetical protein|nr:hypothetical protein [Candidatus Acidoferrum sp.]